MDLTLPRGMAYLGRASQRPTNFEYFRTVNPAAGEFYAHDYEGFDAHGCLNASVKDGSVGAKMHRILDHLKPEAAYFTEFDGLRSGILVVDLKDASEIPAFAEPWFLLFNAKVEFHPTMTPEDLGKAGLDTIGKEWH